MHHLIDDIKKVDALVKKGKFANRSAAIRQMVRHYLDNHADMAPGGIISAEDESDTRYVDEPPGPSNKAKEKKKLPAILG